MAGTVADVMCTGVAAVPETAGCTEIAAILRRHGVTALPVLDPGRRVTGVVSEADLLMQGRHLRRLPVTDPHGRLAGVISRADVLSIFERPDELIRGQVLTKVIGEDFGLNPGAFQVAVNSAEDEQLSPPRVARCRQLTMSAT